MLCNATQLSSFTIGFAHDFGFFATIAHICGHELTNSKDPSPSIFGNQLVSTELRLLLSREDIDAGWLHKFPCERAVSIWEA